MPPHRLELLHLEPHILSRHLDFEEVLVVLALFILGGPVTHYLLDRLGTDHAMDEILLIHLSIYE